MAVITRINFFQAYIHGKGITKCTSVVYDDICGCGTGVMYEDGYGAVSVIYPRNLIAAWRGAEFLSLFKTVKHETLYAVYYAGLRTIEDEVFLQHVISVVGWKNYEKIMSLPVPGIIVDMITKKHVDEPPLLSPIQEEIRAGTIKTEHSYCSPVR